MGHGRIWYAKRVGSWHLDGQWLRDSLPFQAADNVVAEPRLSQAQTGVRYLLLIADHIDVVLLAVRHGPLIVAPPLPRQERGRQVALDGPRSEVGWGVLDGLQSGILPAASDILRDLDNAPLDQLHQLVPQERGGADQFAVKLPGAVEERALHSLRRCVAHHDIPVPILPLDLEDVVLNRSGSGHSDVRQRGVSDHNGAGGIYNPLYGLGWTRGFWRQAATARKHEMGEHVLPHFDGRHRRV